MLYTLITMPATPGGKDLISRLIELDLSSDGTGRVGGGVNISEETGRVGLDLSQGESSSGIGYRK